MQTIPSQMIAVHFVSAFMSSSKKKKKVKKMKKKKERKG